MHGWKKISTNLVSRIHYLCIQYVCEVDAFWNRMMRAGVYDRDWLTSELVPWGLRPTNKRAWLSHHINLSVHWTSQDNELFRFTNKIYLEMDKNESRDVFVLLHQARKAFNS